MAGYLDHYGAGEERREKIIKTAAVALAILIVGGGILFFIFHNYRQEQQVDRFFRLISSHDYKSAYALWGCTEAKPCSGYPFSSSCRTGDRTAPAGRTPPVTASPKAGRAAPA